MQAEPQPFQIKYGTGVVSGIASRETFVVGQPEIIVKDQGFGTVFSTSPEFHGATCDGLFVSGPSLYMLEGSLPFIDFDLVNMAPRSMLAIIRSVLETSWMFTFMIAACRHYLYLNARFESFVRANREEGEEEQFNCPVQGLRKPSCLVRA